MMLSPREGNDWARRALAVGLTMSLPGCAWSGMRPALSSAPPSTQTKATREVISRLAGDSPNFAQMSNGTLMTVVSRDFGRGAKAGALVELYYPHYAVDHLWDSYVGVGSMGRFQWAHQLKLVGQSLVPDSGCAVTTFTGPGYTLVLEDLVRPGANAHIRRATITNVSPVPLTGLSTDFYAFFMLGGLPGGDRLHYDAQAQALVQVDDQVAVAVASDHPTTDWQCGDANLPLGSARDARQVAESGRWPHRDHAGPLPTGVNGAFRQALPDLAPQAAVSVTYALGVGASEAGALAEAKQALGVGWEGLKAEEAAAWKRWLAPSRQPASMPQAVSETYRRALITLKQQITDEGAIIAAPTNFDPPYRFVWPRDGSLIALTLLQAGYPNEAKRFFDFVERLQKPSGGWAVNFFPDGHAPLWDFGDRGNEHDEVGTFAWAVGRVARQTGDTNWALGHWPAVRRACEFLVTQQREDGLLTTCRDLWELSQDGSWTYSNAAACAGLVAGADLAERAGDAGAASRYRLAAQRMRQAMAEHLVSNGVFVRGLRNRGLDPTIEAANLALGSAGFGVFGDDDPRMRATGEAVAQRLQSPWGGIRRYEGDRYYDGQPWPVATAWLAQHRLAIGDRAGAEGLMAVMTRYAHQTDALMLGEQFDEDHQRWVSAFPLAWSEAQYAKLALQLYDH